MKLRRIKKAQEPLHIKSKRKRKARRILRFVNTILITALFISTIVYTAMSPFFYIEKIDAVASSHYDSSTLTAISGVIIGENGFRLLFEEPGMFYLLRIGSAERKLIEGCPYIKSAKVRFIIPSTVNIEVIERKPAALLRLNETSFIIDREGYLLELNQKQDMAALPIFEGIEPDSYTLGTKITNDEQKLTAAFRVYDYLEQMDGESLDKFLPSVDYIDVSEPNSIRLSLQSRISANLGKGEELNYKINAIKAIMENNIKKDDRGKLDFSLDEKIVFTPENGG